MADVDRRQHHPVAAGSLSWSIVETVARIAAVAAQVQRVIEGLAVYPEGTVLGRIPARR